MDELILIDKLFTIYIMTVVYSYLLDVVSRMIIAKQCISGEAEEKLNALNENHKVKVQFSESNSKSVNKQRKYVIIPLWNVCVSTFLLWMTLGDKSQMESVVKFYNKLIELKEKKQNE